MISQADRKATDMALRTREPRATTKAIQRETRTKMTKQEWEYLCSAYRNYNSRLVLDESGNLNLLVG